MKPPFLSIIIPCYNEHENIERGVLKEVNKFLKKQPYTYEVIISDDASKDNSRELVEKYIAKEKYFKLLKNQHGGKSYALKHGLQVAKGTYTLFTDMDQSTPIVELVKLLPYTKKGYEVIIGSRGQQRSGANVVRKIASRMFGLFRKMLVLPHIDDTQCGFKLAKTSVLKKIFNSMLIFHQPNYAQGWTVAAWDVEFLYLAEKCGHKIAEVSVEWTDRDETKGKDRSGKFIKESIDMLKQVTRVRLNDFTGKYERK